MTWLAVLLAQAAAGGAAIAAYPITNWGMNRSPIRLRYVLSSLGFWIAPIVGMLTLGMLMTNSGRADDAPPVALVHLTAAANHQLVGTTVVLLLLIGGAVAGLRLVRLGIATSNVRTLVRRARGRHWGPIDRAAGDRSLLAVLTSDDVSVPVLAGFWRPVILLPAVTTIDFTPEQIAAICAHEAVHARRHDNVRLWLEEAASALLWWSPTMGRSRRALAAAREVTCDAIVLDRATAKERRAYAATLLQVLGQRPTLMTAYATGGGIDTARRIRLLLAPDDQPTSRLPLLLALTGLLSVASVTALLADRVIVQTGASFVRSGPITMSFKRTGTLDRRTRQPLYHISYAWPRGAVETLLGSPPPTTTGTVEMQRLPDGGWRVLTD